MSSNLGAHRYADPDMQIPLRSQRWDSSVHFRGLGCKLYSTSDVGLADRGDLGPRRLLQGIRAQGIGFKTLSHGVSRASLLKEQNTLPRGFAYHTDGAIPGDGTWALFSSSQDSALSYQLQPGHVLEPRRLSATTKVDDSIRGSVVSINTGVAEDFGQLTQMSDDACLSIPQNSSVPRGWLSLGLCGNALIMRIGSDARCFHHQGSSCRLVDLGERASCDNSVYAPTDVKVLRRSYSKVGTILESNGKDGVSLRQGKTSTTKSREDNSRGRQNKQRKVGKTTALTRNLYEKSSFHLFEVLFCLPFLNSNAVASDLQNLSRQSLKELVNILNRTAVGLASVSAIWILFVGSRILSLDFSINKHTMASLAIGFGFLSLSWAMKRVSDFLMCLTEIYSRSRALQSDYITGLQKQLQCVALGACLLLVTCFMGGG